MGKIDIVLLCPTPETNKPGNNSSGSCCNHSAANYSFPSGCRAILIGTEKNSRRNKGGGEKRWNLPFSVTARLPDLDAEGLKQREMNGMGSSYRIFIMQIGIWGNQSAEQWRCCRINSIKYLDKPKTSKQRGSDWRSDIWKGEIMSLWCEHSSMFTLISSLMAFQGCKFPVLWISSLIRKAASLLTPEEVLTSSNFSEHFLELFLEFFELELLWNSASVISLRAPMPHWYSQVRGHTPRPFFLFLPNMQIYTIFFSTPLKSTFTQCGFLIFLTDDLVVDVEGERKERKKKKHLLAVTRNFLLIKQTFLDTKLSPFLACFIHRPPQPLMPVGWTGLRGVTTRLLEWLLRRPLPESSEH